MFAIDATTLRLLLICGALALIVLLVFIKYRRRKQTVRRQHINEIPLGPLFSVEEEAEEKEQKKQQEEKEDPIVTESQPPKPDPDNRNVISVTLRTKRREGFNGKQLLSTLARFNLEHGDMNIFHRIIHTGEKKNTSFSILNGIEPGILNPEELKKGNTPAIIFFIRLHGCNQPLKAFAEMIDIAQQFSHLLDGQLFDDQGSHLSEQTIVYYKDLIREFLLGYQVSPQDDGD